MLTFCALLFFGLSGLQAQVPYHFQLPDDIHPVASTDAGYDILTMDCLAANGYGQWTSSSSTENATLNPVSFLLSNKFNEMPATPGSLIWDDVQTGVLAAKEFQYNSTDVYPTEAIKCVANLQGNVRYVWIDNTSGRDKFYVEGFDPGTAGGSTGIDISFAGLPSNLSIVKDTKANLYVEGIIQSSHSLVTNTSEPLYADMFDIAIDANYLYIVWEEVTGVGPTYKIFAAAVNLSSSAVTQLGMVGTGMGKPTVAVDVRHSGGIADIDVASISHVGGVVNWIEWNGTTWSNILVPNFAGTPGPWMSATHARIIDASAAGTGSTDKGIYFIAKDHSGNVSLFFNRITAGTLATSCNYCDGTLITTARPAGSPIETAGGFPVVDDYIRAFANPYDGNTTSGSFDEFHCMYVLNHTAGVIPIGSLGGDYPLMVIHATNSSTGYCVSGNNVAALFPYCDPISPAAHQPFLYVGAVNQMGIHTHWTGDSSSVNLHYYRRDKREFDQAIEENTLMTDTCVIGNTESGVGTSSPTVLPNLYLTLFADPVNYDALFIDQVALVSNAWLDFDNGATLNIGNSTDGGSDFVIVGSYYGSTVLTYCGQRPGLLDPFTFTTNSWTINFGADNSMDDYYTGMYFFGSGQFSLNGTGETMTSTTVGNYVSSISDPVKWNIHNTSFYLLPSSSITFSNAISFTATDAIFDFLGNDVTYQPGFPSNLAICSNGSFTNCILKPDPSSSYFGISLFIGGSGSWDQFTSVGTGDANYLSSYYPPPDGHTVTLTSCYSTVGIDIEGSNPIAPASVAISKGLFESYGIMAGVQSVSPWWPISISQATFDQIKGQGIVINEGMVPSGDALGIAISQLYSILIDDNDFKTFASTSSYFGSTYPYTNYSAGITLANAPDLTLDDALREAIAVTNNTFDTIGSYGHNGSINAAIHFMGATGDIGFNSITPGMVPTVSDNGSKYKRGIWNESNDAAYPQNMTWSFICSNTVSGLISSLYTPALYTDYYKGYAKLNSFTQCSIGQLSSINDNGHIDFSSYTNMGVAAYAGYFNSITDLSGVHSSSSASAYDDPAFDTFTTTYSGLVQQIYLDGSLAIVYLGLEPFTPTWTVYGENTIVRSPGYYDIGSSGSVTLGDISNNYWGGVNYHNAYITASGGYLTSVPTNPGFECSSGLSTKRKGAVPMSLLMFDTAKIDTSQAACGEMGAEGYALESQSIEPEGYDTLRAFLEGCPLYPNSWQAMSMIAGAAQDAIRKGYGSYPEFLTWLKKVLYYNPDTIWYCQDVDDMLQAVQNAADAESICRYILSSGKCPALAAIFEGTNASAVSARHLHWIDSLVSLYPISAPYFMDSIRADTLRHPFADTAVPTLFQDSLEILMGPQYAGVQANTPSPITSQALLSAQLLENPLKDEIDVSYQMGRTALVTMELRDILGRSVPIANAKYQLEQPGSHNSTFPAPNLPQGIYYLRITTDVGDAITLKIVKE